MIRFSAADDGKTVEVRNGTEFELVLAENPTTGFRWHVRQDPAPTVALAADKLLPGHRPGQPGTHVWRWRAQKPGAAEMGLVLGRAFGGGVARTYRLRVQVR